jgi:hypothetical protein
VRPRPPCLRHGGPVYLKSVTTYNPPPCPMVGMCGVPTRGGVLYPRGYVSRREHIRYRTMYDIHTCVVGTQYGGVPRGHGAGGMRRAA